MALSAASWPTTWESYVTCPCSCTNPFMTFPYPKPLHTGSFENEEFYHHVTEGWNLCEDCATKVKWKTLMRPWDTRFQCTGKSRLPVAILVRTSRPLFTLEKRLGYRVAWWLVMTKYEKKNMEKHGVLPVHRNRGTLHKVPSVSRYRCTALSRDCVCRT